MTCLIIFIYPVSAVGEVTVKQFENFLSIEGRDEHFSALSTQQVLP